MALPQTKVSVQIANISAMRRLVREVRDVQHLVMDPSGFLMRETFKKLRRVPGLAGAAFAGYFVGSQIAQAATARIEGFGAAAKIRGQLTSSVRLAELRQQPGTTLTREQIGREASRIRQVRTNADKRVDLLETPSDRVAAFFDAGLGRAQRAAEMVQGELRIDQLMRAMGRSEQQVQMIGRRNHVKDVDVAAAKRQLGDNVIGRMYGNMFEYAKMTGILDANNTIGADAQRFYTEAYTDVVDFFKPGTTAALADKLAKERVANELESTMKRMQDAEHRADLYVNDPVTGYRVSEQRKLVNKLWEITRPRIAGLKRD